MKEKNGSEEIFILPSSTAALRDVAIIQTVATDNTDSAFIPKLKLSAYYNAAGTPTEREGFAVEGGASATKIGFFGATCVVKPTLSTVAALGVSLVALGLFSGTLTSDYTIIQDNGTPLTQRPYLNFIAGSNVALTIADDAGNTRTNITIAASGSGGTYPPATCQGRLTLTTGVPVTISDVTAATTLYFTPYKGNLIGTYSGSAWSTGTFTEKSITLASLTANLPYDVFIVDSTYALELVAWTNNTTRATALVLQDGIEVKSGATTRRYLGTICITGTTGQCEDSLAKRFVWNRYNRVTRAMLARTATTTWTYSTIAYRQANADAAYQLAMIAGLQEDTVTVCFGCRAGSLNAGVSIGENSTTAAAANVIEGINVAISSTIYAHLTTVPRVGYSTYVPLESSVSGASVTFFGTNTSEGNNAGINALWAC